MTDVDLDYCDTKLRKARKQHTCRECWLTIQPGDTYEYGTALQEGSWHNWKLCLSCKAWANATGVSGEGWQLGELSNVIAELHDRTPIIPGTFQYQHPRVYYVDSP